MQSETPYAQYCQAQTVVCMFGVQKVMKLTAQWGLVHHAQTDQDPAESKKCFDIWSGLQHNDRL